jgi:hypothetical protein
MTNKDKQLTEIKAYREKIEKHYNTINALNKANNYIKKCTELTIIKMKH